MPNETATVNTGPGSRPTSLSFVKVPADGGQVEVNDEVEDVEEEMVIRVVRSPGTGLGISIAGGVGATPFRDGDEVCLFFSPLTPTVAIMGTAIKHTMPDRVKPSFAIFDIRAL